MNDYLKTYTISLTTLAPVFIGSGSKIAKKEYITDRKEKKAYIPDLRKLYAGLKKLNLTRSYEEYMLNGKNQDDLGDWLYKNKVGRDTYMPWISYSMDSSDIHFEENNRRDKKEVSTFIKDGYGLPYVPGTSIKGMLRTIILAYMIKCEPQRFDKSRVHLLKDAPNKERAKRKYYLAGNAKSLEVRAFNRLSRNKERSMDAVNDIFSGIVISDSKPLSCDDLALCQKIDLPIVGEGNPLPILRECLKPGIKIECALTVDTQLCPFITPDYIMRAVDYFAAMYNKVFVDVFYEPDAPEDLKGVVYLGGGVGFISKTEVYPLLGSKEGVSCTVDILKNTMGYKNFKEHKHDEDIRNRISPHMLKMTSYKNELMEMGRCRLSIK